MVRRVVALMLCTTVVPSCLHRLCLRAHLKITALCHLGARLQEAAPDVLCSAKQVPRRTPVGVSACVLARVALAGAAFTGGWGGGFCRQDGGPPGPAL